MRFAKIKHWDIANGEGVRISLFISGCKFHCEDCFNEEAQDFSYGELYTKSIEDEIVNLVSNPHIDGLSLLGGDPLWQTDEDIDSLCQLVNRVKALGKTVWIWSGFTIEHLSAKQRELVGLCDIFVDGQFEKEKKNLNLKWRGSSNQRVIDVKQSMLSKSIIQYN